jgi:hypothetical protein
VKNRRNYKIADGDGAPEMAAGWFIEMKLDRGFPKTRPRRQFWESCLRFRGKKRALDRFFESFSQN